MPRVEVKEELRYFPIIFGAQNNSDINSHIIDGISDLFGKNFLSYEREIDDDSISVNDHAIQLIEQIAEDNILYHNLDNYHFCFYLDIEGWNEKRFAKLIQIYKEFSSRVNNNASVMSASIYIIADKTMSIERKKEYAESIIRIKYILDGESSWNIAFKRPLIYLLMKPFNLEYQTVLFASYRNLHMMCNSGFYDGAVSHSSNYLYILTMLQYDKEEVARLNEELKQIQQKRINIFIDYNLVNQRLNEYFNTLYSDLYSGFDIEAIPINKYLTKWIFLKKIFQKNKYFSEIQKYKEQASKSIDGYLDNALSGFEDDEQNKTILDIVFEDIEGLVDIDSFEINRIKIDYKNNRSYEQGPIIKQISNLFYAKLDTLIDEKLNALIYNSGNICTKQYLERKNAEFKSALDDKERKIKAQLGLIGANSDKEFIESFGELLDKRFPISIERAVNREHKLLCSPIMSESHWKPEYDHCFQNGMNYYVYQPGLKEYELQALFIVTIDLSDEQYFVELLTK